jgi:hypothetical protein
MNLDNKLDLDHYIKTETKYINECYQKQLTKTPNMSMTIFILQKYVSLGYAQAYNEYYNGLKHKREYVLK